MFRDVANDSADTGKMPVLVAFKRNNFFQITLLTQCVPQTMSETDRLKKLQTSHLGNLARSSFFADQDAKRLTNQFKGRPAKKPRAGFIDARDASIHVARVDNVGSLLHNLAVPAF